jgi:ferredoxin
MPEKYADNVPGSWYVVDNCIFCGLCSQVASANFKDADDHDYVYKQPENDAELAECIEASEACPVSAIKNGE